MGEVGILGSIEDLLDDFCGADLCEVVGSVGAVEEGHHFEPVEDGRLFLEEFAAQVLLPVLEALQLIGEHP